MVIYIKTTVDYVIKIHPDVHTIIKAIRDSKQHYTFNDVIMDLLNDSINSNPQNFLKICRRGGINIEVPGFSSHWSIPENLNEKPKKIDLRKSIVKYVIEKGIDDE